MPSRLQMSTLHVSGRRWRPILWQLRRSTTYRDKTMATTRRDFLRNSACALGGMALASSMESFGIVHALTPQAATDYRALVCIFLNGGNDGNNMVVSRDQYTAYAAARSTAGLAIPEANLLTISPSSGGLYGLHPNM